jgi:uncharacterized damage-inducible protein DinB
MSEDSRNQTPAIGDERTMLLAFLNLQRETVIWKISGLDKEKACQTTPTSTMHLLGLVKHLAYVERWWFQKAFAGHDVTFPWTKEDPDADWRAEPEDTVEDIIELYKGEIAAANAIVAEHSFDDTFKGREGDVSLRWVVLHMIEETARHAGHADILREAIDGATGE